ncbi:hypothetical protein ACFSX9_10830 [Flavobacterium ardleyense]|uniref:Uncharacterized protein n=1 Tax=Flavobacterium ardleyense TaxID=2038737 RepID=A0ABW5Z9N8_9FLAO
MAQSYRLPMMFLGEDLPRNSKALRPIGFGMETNHYTNGKHSRPKTHSQKTQ